MEKHSKKMGTVIIAVLIVVFTVLFVFSVWKLMKIHLSYAASHKEYEELRQLIIADEGEMGDWLPDKEEPGHMKDVSEEKEDNSFQITKDKTICPITVDFQKLWEINPDIKAWIYLEELDIHYPVVQGESNDDYLYTSVMGTANSAGSIFLDSHNKPDFSDPHTIIYGHNMKNGSMFGSLKKLGDQKVIDEIEEPVCFWIITPDKAARYDVISVRTADIMGDTYTLFSGPGDVVAEYINQRARTSIVALDHRTYLENDKIVTLSTCTGNDQYRLVVHGVLYEE